MILDCTLRDGGYVNNWSFSGSETSSIIQSLVYSGIDIIECGFVSQKKGRPGSTQFPDFGSIESILGDIKIGQDRKPLFVAMINYGEFDLNTLPACSRGDHSIQGIRIAFHKKQWKDFAKDAHKIVDKGYKLFVQPMLTVGYTDREILDLLDAFHPIDYYAMYIVDTFGSMSGEQFRRYHALFESNLKEEAILGYHSHNNLQLAYSNSIIFLDLAHTRRIIIDSSILGMGRGAGNLNSELLAGYMNQRIGSDYRIGPLLEVIDSYLENIKLNHAWGYSIAHFLSASINCHPNYSGFLLGKKNLAVSEIKTMLDLLPEDSRVRYDESLIRQIYEDHRSKAHRTADLQGFSLTGNQVLALASGPSARTQLADVEQWRKDSGGIVIALNHLPQFIDIDYTFITNQKRYDEFCDQLDPRKLIVATNLLIKPSHHNCPSVDYRQLLEAPPTGSDNVAALFLSFVEQIGLSEVSFAGLDGYSVNSEANYSYPERGGPSSRDVQLESNRQMEEAIKDSSTRLKINFVTRSRFESVLPLSICGVIPARYQSSRFEGKPLAVIAGVPMLKRTYDRVKDCAGLDHLTVATDDERIMTFCKDNRIPCVMTSNDCPTGTDRVAEVADSTDFDFYINIQGDEPLIELKAIEQVVEGYLQHREAYAAYNLYKKVESSEQPDSSSMIKVVVNESDELMFMSRHPVPFEKGANPVGFFKQVCVYGFTRKALADYAGWQRGPVESSEDVEILRFIEKGLKVRMIETDSESVAVDLPEDIQKVEERIAGLR